MADYGYNEAIAEIAKQRGPGAYAGDLPMHANVFRGVAGAVAPIAGPTITSGALQGAGYINEVIDALRGLYNKKTYGFDSTDLAANKIGIDRGILDALRGQ